MLSRKIRGVSSEVGRVGPMVGKVGFEPRVKERELRMVIVLS